MLADTLGMQEGCHDSKAVMGNDQQRGQERGRGRVKTGGRDRIKRGGGKGESRGRGRKGRTIREGGGQGAWGGADRGRREQVEGGKGWRRPHYGYPGRRLLWHGRLTGAPLWSRCL